MNLHFPGIYQIFDLKKFPKYKGHNENVRLEYEIKNRNINGFSCT